MSSCDDRDMWLFVLKYAVKAALGVLRNILILAVAAGASCAVYFVAASAVEVVFELRRVLDGIPAKYIFSEIGFFMLTLLPCGLCLRYKH